MGGHSNENDPLDSSSVQTRVFSLCYLPIFAIDAFRVKKDSYTDRLIFIQKEKLSLFGKVSNTIAILILSTLLASICLVSYSHSDRYKTNTLIAEADKLIQNNKTSQGLKAYLKAYDLVSIEKKPEIVESFALAIFDTFKTNDWKRIKTSSDLLIHSPFFDEIKDQFPDLHEVAIRRAKQVAEQSPETALVLMKLAEQAAEADLDWRAERRAILETAVVHSKKFDEPSFNELSAIYEASGETDKILQLLRPHSHIISGSEMALRLGIAEVNAAHYPQAIPHFASYLAGREQTWISASKHLNRAYSLTIQNLDNRNAAPSLYESAYQFHTGQQPLVQWQRSLEHAVQSDPKNQTFLDQLKQTRRVPEALMNLAICHLEQAQSETSDRNEQLHLAESALLRISHIASDSPEYQFFLGQVYYWLGKNQQGKALFDSLAKKFNNNPEQQMTLVTALSDVGRTAEAKELANQAFALAKNENDRQRIAHLRSTISTDLNEQIEWLQKSNQSSPVVKIDLYTAEGNLAISKNKIAAGINLLKKAITGYNKQAESASSLNNCALIHFNIFNATGDTDHYKDGLIKIEKALDLVPNDSVLNSNASTVFFEAACLEILKRQAQPILFQQGIGVKSLDYLYNSERDYLRLTEQLKAHPYYKKACLFFQRSILLAPQNQSLYLQGASIFAWSRDLQQLNHLKSKLVSSKLDYNTSQKQWVQSIAKQNPTDTIEELQHGQQTYLKQLDKSNNDFAKAIIEVAKMSVTVAHWSPLEVTNAEETVAAMKRFNKQFPNAVFDRSLKAAITIQAAQSIAEKNPLFKQWIISAKDQVSLESLLLLWTVNQKNPSDVLQRHPSVKDFFFTSHQQAMKYKAKANNFDLGVATLVAPSDRAILGSELSNSIQTQSQFITNEMYHYLPEQKLQMYWKLLANKQKEQANRYYLSIQNEIKSISGWPLLPSIE